MPSRQVRPIVRVAIPVFVAAVLVCLAAVNVALVHRWQQVHEFEDGILWMPLGANLVAGEVESGSAGDRAGIRRGDMLQGIDNQPVERLDQVTAALHAASGERPLTYLVTRDSAQGVISVTLQPLTSGLSPLYFPLALVGVFAIVVAASVRLRRPADRATLHFFWLTVAFSGVLAFTYSGKFDRADFFFFWADVVATAVLPPLFLHFAFVFPERPHPWIRTGLGRGVLPVLYVPAVVLIGWRVMALRRASVDVDLAAQITWIDSCELAYLAACLLGGLALMMRALTRLRSATARRQLRWIVWGSAIGAVPFVAFYVVPFLFGRRLPFAEFTALLLGSIPLAFASAIVRYRLMDIEVILKRALVYSSVGLIVVFVYQGTLTGVGLLWGEGAESNEFWALFATLVVVLVAPALKSAIQGGLDRLYYRGQYDYRRALVTFARELNSDLDLERLSTRLVTRVRDTLVIDKITLLLVDPASAQGGFAAVASLGGDDAAQLSVDRASPLGTRLAAGQTVVIDDPLPVRRLGGDDANPWRDAGWHAFVPCVSKEATIAVLAVGRKARGEPLSSEDMALLGAVAGQAATALENARLYGQLRIKADEIERLRQFSDGVVESLNDGLFVVDLDDRVLRWNRRLEELSGIERDRAMGRRVPALFAKAFVETLTSARQHHPAGTTMYRVPLAASSSQKKALVVNVGLAPLQTVASERAGWIIVIEDVTDRASLEEQLRLSEKMAAIGLLAAGVAHEVNTPLTGISSFTQMLLDRADPDDPKTQLLEKIERQTFRAAKIVNSLLNLARPSDGEAGLVDLNVVVADVLTLLEHQLRTSRIQVRRELASPGPFVRGVEYKLQQVFLNLFLNARDAMPKGGWLSVSTRADDGNAVVEVGDTGVGIPTEHISRIYDPFFTTKAEGRGTGLGLSVTYGIVQEHSGTLTCDSAPGQGTRFHLVIPLSEHATASNS